MQRAAEIAYFTRVIQDQFADSIRATGSLPSSAIASVLDQDPFRLSAEDLAVVRKQLETTFAVTQTVGSVVKDDFKPWLDRRSAGVSWYYWNRLKRYYLEKNVLPANVVSILDGVTNEILDYCGDPNDPEKWRRRGMVMGHVQSGKTTNYSSLICKASDAGYKVIILLAGLTNSLRAQTQERLDETFIGKKSLFRAAIEEFMTVVQYGEGKPRYPAYGTSRDRDFNRQVSDYGVTLDALKEPIIFVTKKNKSTLANLRDWLNTQAQGMRIDYPLLLIDDEADNASINTAKDQNRVTAINGLIRELLNKFERSSYVGYTATPFANIFIDPDTEDSMLSDDLFPRHFIKALDPPSNYVGAERVFSEEGDLRDVMVRVVPDYQEWLPLSHKRSIAIQGLPASLEQAIRCFVIVRALRELAGDGSKHCSMMINVSRFNDVQEQVHSQVYRYLERLRKAIRVNAGLGEKVAVRDADIEAIRRTYAEEYSDAEFTFSALLSALPEASRTIEVRTVNMKGGELDYSQHKDGGLHVIAIGGLALSRGLTLEGLAVSYILRNTAASDTLMQMARWFGYRGGYERLCRVWLANSSLEHYEYIEDAIEELRSEVKRMGLRDETPEDFGLKVRRSETGILITATNKMRSATRINLAQDYSAKHVEGFALYNDRTINERHHTSVADFLKKLGPACDEDQAGDDAVLGRDFEKNLCWTKVDGRAVSALVDTFEFPPAQAALAQISGKRSLFQDYVSDRLAELSEWDVVVPLKSGKKSRLYDRAAFDTLLPIRERKQGQLSGDGASIYKPYGARHRIADRADALLMLTSDERDAVEENKESGKFSGDSAACAARRRPLLVIHVFRATSDGSDPKFKLANDYVVSLSFCMPRTGVEPQQRTYEVNAVYRKQLEFDFESDDDDEVIDRD